MKTILLPLISLLTFTPLADSEGQVIETQINIANNDVYKGYTKTQLINNTRFEGQSYTKITNTRSRQYIQTQENNTYADITISSYTTTELDTVRDKSTNQYTYARNYTKVDILRVKLNIQQTVYTNLWIQNNVQNIAQYGFNTAYAKTYFICSFISNPLTQGQEQLMQQLDYACDTTLNSNQDLYDFWLSSVDGDFYNTITGLLTNAILDVDTNYLNSETEASYETTPNESIGGILYFIQESKYSSTSSTEPQNNPNIDFLLSTQATSITGTMAYLIQLEQITTVINYEVLDIPGLMFTILGMPFAFISTAFDLTLFAGTPYAINITTLFFTLIGSLIIIYVLKKVIK